VDERPGADVGACGRALARALAGAGAGAGGLRRLRLRWCGRDDAAAAGVTAALRLPALARLTAPAARARPTSARSRPPPRAAARCGRPTLPTGPRPPPSLRRRRAPRRGRCSPRSRACATSSAPPPAGTPPAALGPLAAGAAGAALRSLELVDGGLGAIDARRAAAAVAMPARSVLRIERAPARGSGAVRALHGARSLSTLCGAGRAWRERGSWRRGAARCRRSSPAASSPSVKRSWRRRRRRRRRRRIFLLFLTPPSNNMPLLRVHPIAMPARILALLALLAAAAGAAQAAPAACGSAAPGAAEGVLLATLRLNSGYRLFDCLPNGARAAGSRTAGPRDPPCEGGRRRRRRRRRPPSQRTPHRPAPPRRAARRLARRPGPGRCLGRGQGVGFLVGRRADLGRCAPGAEPPRRALRSLPPGIRLSLPPGIRRSLPFDAALASPPRHAGFEYRDGVPIWELSGATFFGEYAVAPPLPDAPLADQRGRMTLLQGSVPADLAYVVQFNATGGEVPARCTDPSPQGLQAVPFAADFFFYTCPAPPPAPPPPPAFYDASLANCPDALVAGSVEPPPGAALFTTLNVTGFRAFTCTANGTVADPGQYLAGGNFTASDGSGWKVRLRAARAARDRLFFFFFLMIFLLLTRRFQRLVAGELPLRWRHRQLGRAPPRRGRRGGGVGLPREPASPARARRERGRPECDGARVGYLAHRLGLRRAGARAADRLRVARGHRGRRDADGVHGRRPRGRHHQRPL
jgi:hypothetical protein